MHFRRISIDDNNIIKSITLSVLAEFGASGEGFASADPELNNMYESYSLPNSFYYVVFEGGEIIGGAGISQLKGEGSSICELQKMYFKKNYRGKGIGRKLIEKCLEEAIDLGFKQCYLETLPHMAPARKLYESLGFRYIENRMGETGHSKCPVFMLRDL